ncbi:venom allergen 5.01 [Daphnia magna]|uniref:venom allergen 5.01 n=1 Tax=Daphnia magna TaxID=35525 RepID=UPI001E1BC95F|nr:venom allergen 5.01 [Daphnia magna]
MKFFAVFLLIVVCLFACGDSQTTLRTTTKPTARPTTTRPTTTRPTTARPTTTRPTTTRPTTTKPTPTTTRRTTPTTTRRTTPTTTRRTTPTTTRTTPTTKTTGKTTPTTTKPTPTATKPQETSTTTKPDVTSARPTVTTSKPTTLTSYCNISTCRVPTDNTLCKYSNTTWGEACQPPYPTVSSVSTDEITIILKAHNDYRRQVAQGLETRGNPGPQPSASNMRQLIWDEELAVMAQTHAQQCVFEHDTCRDVSRFRVGQNIYIGASSADNLGTSNWNAAVTSWYDEVDDMKAAYVTSFPANPPSVIGHYTQVVWASSYTVGCGVAYYQSTATFGAGFPYNRLYVCNYGPTGNFINSPVYAQGTAGSACPASTSNNNGLCA